MPWKPPWEAELPKAETPPPMRPPKKPSYVARGICGLAGIALLVSGGVGLWRSLHDTTGAGNPIMALAVLLPTVILLRYALTGVIKGNR